MRLVLSGLVAVIVAGGAAAVALSEPTVYRSTTLVAIDQTEALAAATDGGLLDKLSRLRIKYADLVPTPVIAGEAAEALGLPPGQVIGSVAAEVPQLTLTVVIGARAGDADTAVAIANGVATALVGHVDEELQAADVPQEQRYEFRVLVPAVGATQVQPSRDDALQAAVSFGLLALGATYVLFELIEAVGRRRSPS